MQIDIVGSYRQAFTTGAVTTLAAGAQIFSMRWVSSTLFMRLRALEPQFILTTAFGAAQEVGFDAWTGRSYSASPSNGTQVTIGANDAKLRTSYPTSVFNTAGDVRTANASAITAGTVTLDGGPIAKDSIWAAAVGATLPWRRYDFTQYRPRDGGILYANNEGPIVKNTILMGAAGVGHWVFTVEWDEVLVTP